MQIGNRVFNFDQEIAVMGILNRTPDSFSDGGSYDNLEKALRRVEEMISEGADIIDIGGESTRPGHPVVSVSEEINRVIPIIQGIRRLSDVPISIDTMKSEVAEAALLAGASMINDVWGFKFDNRMAGVAKTYGVPCCLMHNRHEAGYHQLIPDMISDLNESIYIAEKAGVSESQLIIDPGIGFGKTLEDNLHVMKHLEAFVAMGYPVLLGTSRKSMIGLTLGLPVDQRLEGTLATTVFGVIKGCKIIRVHDIKENVRAIKMTQAMRGTNEWTI